MQRLKPFFFHIVCMIPVLLCTVFTGCASAPAESPLPAEEESPPFVIFTEEVHVTIPGMKDEVKLAFLSDLHIASLSDEVSEEETDNVSFRHNGFSNGEITAQEMWPGWVSALNSTGADLVLFGGDMTDFASDTNLSILRDGLDKITLPYVYIRADHDTEPYYLKNTDREHCIDVQKSLCEYTDVFVREFPDFVVIGWNNSTSQLTPGGLDAIQRTLDKKKPAILLTHVPVEPLSDGSLAKASRDTYAGRSLLWGYGDNHDVPDENTRQLLELIYAKDSPFKEILAGHLHFTWDGYVTDTVHEHVFGPAFYGDFGIITVNGEQNADTDQ